MTHQQSDVAGAERLLKELPGKLGLDVRVVRAPCMGACDHAPVCAVGHVQTVKATVDSVARAVDATASARSDAETRVPMYRRYRLDRRTR